MASKETKRERRELAKKTRMEAQRRAARARRMRKIYGGATAAAALILIVALILWNNSRSAGAVKELNELASAAGCTELQSPAEGGQGHVDTDVQYATNPPTSGDHANAWWALDDPSNVNEFGGPQTTTIQEERLVHNLEHGHVVLHYRPDVDPATITALNDVATSEAGWVIAQPNPELATSAAFAAWGKIITCDGTGPADQIRAAATKFVEVHKDKGPERGIPPMKTA